MPCLSRVSGIFVALGLLHTRLQILFFLICSRQFSGLIAMSHKVHASWTSGHDSQANQGAFSKGACGHGMQKLGWIFLPQLKIWKSLHWPASWLALWGRLSKGTEHDLHKNCIRYTESQGRRSQITTMSHFMRHICGYTTSYWSHPWGQPRKVLCYPSIWLSSWRNPVKWCQLLGHHHYLQYGGGIGSAAVLLDLEHLGYPNQDAIPRLKGLSIQRNFIDKLLQSRR